MSEPFLVHIQASKPHASGVTITDIDGHPLRGIEKLDISVRGGDFIVARAKFMPKEFMLMAELKVSHAQLAAIAKAHGFRLVKGKA